MNEKIRSQTAAPNHSAEAPKASSTAWNVALWVLQVLLAAAFFLFGGAKLAGAEGMVRSFEAIGVGQWFRYVTGLLEVTGAVLLLTPALAGLGGLLLLCVLIGAVLTHLFVIGGSALLALVLLPPTALVVWGRRQRTLHTLRRG